MAKIVINNIAHVNIWIHFSRTEKATKLSYKVNFHCWLSVHFTLPQKCCNFLWYFFEINELHLFSGFFSILGRWVHFHFIAGQDPLLSLRIIQGLYTAQEMTKPSLLITIWLLFSKNKHNEKRRGRKKRIMRKISNISHIKILKSWFLINKFKINHSYKLSTVFFFHFFSCQFFHITLLRCFVIVSFLATVACEQFGIWYFCPLDYKTGFWLYVEAVWSNMKRPGLEDGRSRTECYICLILALLMLWFTVWFTG